MLPIYLSMVADEDNKSKIELIYNTYKNLMMNRAYDILKDKALAEDAVHNAFIRIIKNISKIDITQSHKTRAFVVIIVENVAKTMYKKEHKILPVEMSDMPCADDLAESTEAKMDVQYIALKIAQLPSLYRDVLTLKYFNNLTDKEIATVLEITNENSRKRLQRAKAALYKLLEGGENDA